MHGKITPDCNSSTHVQNTRSVFVEYFPALSLADNEALNINKEAQYIVMSINNVTQNTLAVKANFTFSGKAPAETNVRIIRVRLLTLTRLRPICGLLL